MIKNVVFDIGNVLVDFGWAPFFEKFHLSKDEYDRIAKATVFSPVWNEIDRGVMSEEEILEKFIENDPELSKKLTEIYEDFNGLLKMFEYTRGWIIDLKNRGYKVYCLSNMSHKAVRECWDALCFVEETDGYLFSCNEHLIKPDPAIYKRFFEKFKLNPSECVFIDDLERNIEAAKEAGMHGIVFKNVKQAEEELSKIVKEEGFQSSYTKPQRIASLICVILIGLLYVATLVLSLLKAPVYKNLFKIALGATLVLPILTWVYIWMIGKLTKKKTIADFHFFEK